MSTLAAIRRRLSARSGIQFCESCGQVTTTADRAAAMLAHTRDQITLLGPPR